MKKRAQKLVLSRETILHLGPEVRRAVGGDYSLSPCYTDDFMICVTTTNTTSLACPSVTCFNCPPLTDG